MVGVGMGVGMVGVSPLPCTSAPSYLNSTLSEISAPFTFWFMITSDFAPAIIPANCAFT